MIISNFYFDPMRIELGPYISFLRKQRTIIMCATDWSLIRMKQFLYGIHQHSEKRINISCKVTLGFKYMIIYFYGELKKINF